MNSQIGFIVKLFAISTVLSFVIKYGGAYLAIAPTSINALIGISIFPVMMASLLLWRWKGFSDRA